MKCFKSIKTKKKFMLSYRWITFCIDRKQIVRDLKKHCLPNLLPWVHPMPLPEFQDYKVTLKGFNNHYKYVLREVVETLGGKFVDWKNRDTLTSSEKLVVLNPKPEKFREQLKSDKYFLKNGIDLNSLVIKKKAWLFTIVSNAKIEL